MCGDESITLRFFLYYGYITGFQSDLESRQKAVNNKQLIIIVKYGILLSLFFFFSELTRNK